MIHGLSDDNSLTPISTELISDNTHVEHVLILWMTELVLYQGENQVLGKGGKNESIKHFVHFN